MGVSAPCATSPENKTDLSPDLPGVLALIADATDVATALKVAAAFGGTRLFVAISPRPTSALARVVGVDAATAIARYVGHGDIEIPMSAARGQGGRRRRVAQMLGAGASVREAALGGDVCERTVRRIRARVDEPLPLFDGLDLDR